MEFLALIHGSENGWNELSDDERQTVYQRYMKFSERPEVVGGAELQETTTATTVRVRNGDSMVTDGPYAEVKEALGGFLDTKLPDLDTALTYAAKIPASEYGSIEVRPVVERE